MKKFALALFASLLTATATSEQINVFAASSMTNVLQQLGEKYQQQYPEDQVQFSFASSSVLAKQIEQDAPADLFISADQKWADYVAEKQPQKIQQIRPLVKNDLVLIAPNDSDLRPQPIEQIDFKQILQNDYLSVGDPDHVPVGIYAKKALTSFNRWEQIEPRLASAKNVRDALSFVERGESPLGIVYSTDANISTKVKIIATFPQVSYGEVVYPLVQLSDKAAAKRFADYLVSEQAKPIFEQAGFRF
ncbi:molybdate ABC transporter substrate-binding protein [Haemophilus paracuniculus]|uniref:Molybdate ABC transporter substrate-binding protein n=1 Tax=Haemophilus paracuniculus TaxID=734 RepID=A0A1T0AT72_9PAST|nr:molybdate ABC transporter substrate-binding protein [Haemophilus paracuniculus]OOR99210.1 molybdate ABC transporter substrate-binding protein [Haemophilus paracuniculus]